MNTEAKTQVLTKPATNWYLIALIVAVALLVWLATAYWFQFSYAGTQPGSGFMPMMGGLTFTQNGPDTPGGTAPNNQQYQQLHQQCQKLMEKNGIDMNKMHQQMHGGTNGSPVGPGMMGTGFGMMGRPL